MLCVPRQLAELLNLPLQIGDFNSICPGNWQQRGVSPAEIRTFLRLAQRPHVLRRLQGAVAGLLPASRERGEGHRLYVLERPRLLLQERPAVAGCDESQQRQRFRRLRRDNPVPEFKEWPVWEGEIKSGYFYPEDLRRVRAELLAEGHHPKVSMRGNGPRCGCGCPAERTA